MSWAQKIRGGATSSQSNESILGSAPALPGTSPSSTTEGTSNNSTTNNNNNKPAWGSKTHQQNQQQRQKKQQEKQQNLSVPSPKSSSSTTSPAGAAAASSTIMTTPNPSGIDYYVVLDFEATCERDKRLHHQEIIEFPSVLVDAQRAAVVSEFQRFVRPVHNPKLSEFCTNLTGIPQTVVDEAKTFAPVYNEYQEWLNKCGIFEMGIHRVAWVTCGDWDLKTMLPGQLRNPRPQNDAQDAKYKLPQTSPAYFQRWVNLKKVYETAAGRRVNSMPDMASVYNVSLRGHHHSGIDDCRNIAQCLIALLRRQIPVNLTWGNFSPEEYALQKQPFAKRDPNSIPTSDLCVLSEGAAAAIERAQAESKVQQQLEEAASKGTANAAAKTGVAGSVSATTGAGNRRKRENGNTNNNNNGASASAGGVGAAVGTASTASNISLLRPVVDVDTSRNAVHELLKAAGIQPAGDDVQGKVFPKGQSDMTRISKSLSNALRHNALQWGIPMSLNGFVKASDLTRHNRFHQVSNLQLAALCHLSDKQRFSLFFGATKETCNNLYIRANQGHSIEDLVVDMQKITNAKDIPVAVHGTRTDAWNAIRTQGLSRMQRQHIHFASGLPGQDGVISGMRNSSDVLIYLNVAKVLQDGIPLYRSSNGVILSPGQDGIISPAYFEKVVDRRSGRSLN